MKAQHDDKTVSKKLKSEDKCSLKSHHGEEKCPSLFKYLVPIKQYSFVLEVLRAFTIDVEHMTRHNASSAITW